MVVTACSMVKVWLKDLPMRKSKDSSMVAASPTPGISMSQLVTILFLTILANLFILHYQTIAQWCLGFVGSWMLMVHMLTGIFCIADALFQETTSLNTAGNFGWPMTTPGGPMDA